ncbi:MAG TPA: Sec-independent protein translocase protein TatB [Allosphingosinicella sp.]|jgi:sec-independent protein translocase protein TatB
MFDIGYSELLVIAVVALIVIGPKDLPRVMRTVGHWVGRARGMARHFRSGVDTMIRESELEEMEKKWREENDRIMREHPMVAGWDAAAPLPALGGPDGEARTALPEAEPEAEIGEDDRRRPDDAPPPRQPDDPLP